MQIDRRTLLGLGGAVDGGRRRPYSGPAAAAPTPQPRPLPLPPQRRRMAARGWTRNAMRVLRQAGDRAGRHLAARPRASPRHLPLRRLRPAALLLGDQVRQRHRLAELLPAAAERGRHARRQQPVHAPHRSALRQLRRPSRPRLQRRPAPDRPALLHERRWR